MEPRPHERGKGARIPGVRRLLPPLQWSHVLTNVERVANQYRQSYAYTASMEPRPHERGKGESVFPAR